AARAHSSRARSRHHRRTAKPGSRAPLYSPRNAVPSGAVSFMPRTGRGRSARTAASAPMRARRRQASGETPSPQILSRGKRASSTRTTSCPSWRRNTAAAVPAGPPPTTTTSGKRLLRDSQKPIGPGAPDPYGREPGGAEGGAEAGFAEGAADRDEAVFDAHARLEEEGEDRPAEQVGHAR